jgi:hypothetical protein
VPHFSDFLFTAGKLQTWLDERLAESQSAVANWDHAALMARSAPDAFEHFIGKYLVDCPTLHRDRIELLPVSEKPKLLPTTQTRIVLAVPFDGHPEVFRHRPSAWSKKAVWAEVYHGELHLAWEGDAVDPSALHEHFHAELDIIDKRLSAARGTIDRHNAVVREAAAKAVAQRRAKLRAIETGLGFPVRQRADAERYAVPVSRRKITTDAPQTATVDTLEPFLADAQYEAALRVLISMRNALERSPSTTERLNENGIRDLLLVSLNAQFEGDAAGEVFNAEGKTDILIRVDDRNVFIAECKFWKSPKTVSDALDQLLGYLVWRDTKAALLLFVREDDVTSVTEKAIAQITAHPNYKRRGKVASEDRHDFVVHANGDSRREIRLALLTFLIARRKKDRPRC